MPKKKSSLLHRLQHKLGWNTGYCDAFYDKKGRLMMSFVCHECGKRSGIHCVDKTIDKMLED